MNEQYPKHMFQAKVVKDAAEEAALGTAWADTAHVQTSFPKNKHRSMLVHTPDDESKARANGFFDLPSGENMPEMPAPVPADEAAALKARIAELEKQVQAATKQPAVHIGDNMALSPDAKKK